jgi:hypothetical protein
MIVTVSANRVRKVASSMAESPPPTTTMWWLRKKKPSQVAQDETPWPSRVCSPGTFSGRQADPVARMTAFARYAVLPTQTVFTSPVSSTEVASSVSNSAPKCSACLRMLSMRSGPMTASGKPGKFSTSVVVINAPPDWTPSMTNGFRFARAAYTAAV